MGIFTKESRTKFIRNEAGNVVEVENKSNAQINADRIDDKRAARAEKLDNFKNKIKSYAAEKAEQRSLERQAYKESYSKGRIERAHHHGKQQGRYGSSSVVGNIFGSPPMTRKKNGNQQRQSSGYNNLFGFNAPRQQIKKTRHHVQQQHYVVVQGKAYAVAGSGKKHHHKQKKKSKPYDVMTAHIPKMRF